MIAYRLVDDDRRALPRPRRRARRRDRRARGPRRDAAGARRSARAHQRAAPRPAPHPPHARADARRRAPRRRQRVERRRSGRSSSRTRSSSPSTTPTTSSSARSTGSSSARDLLAGVARLPAGEDRERPERGDEAAHRDRLAPPPPHLHRRRSTARTSYHIPSCTGSYGYAVVVGPDRRRRRRASSCSSAASAGSNAGYLSCAVLHLPELQGPLGRHRRARGLDNEARRLPALRLRLPVRADGRLLPGAEHRPRRLRPGGPDPRRRPRRFRARPATASRS